MLKYTSCEVPRRRPTRNGCTAAISLTYTECSQIFMNLALSLFSNSKISSNSEMGTVSRLIASRSNDLLLTLSDKL